MPSKNQSILLGALAYLVAAQGVGFLSLQTGSAGVGGIVVSVLCCLAILVGAGAAVWHYTTTHNVTISPGAGAGMGALAVVLGGLASYLLTLLFQALGVYPSQETLMERGREDALAANPDLTPEQLDQAMGFAEMLQGPIGIVVTIAFAAVVGAIAGAVFAAVFKRGVAPGEV